MNRPLIFLKGKFDFSEAHDKDILCPRRLPNLRHAQNTLPAIPHLVSPLGITPPLYRVKTWTYSTNSGMFRCSREFQNYKSPEKYRIIIFGTAVSFGNGVEDDKIFPVLLENLLNQDSRERSGRFEIFNMGIPGSCTDEGVSLLERVIHSMDYDLLLFCYGVNEGMPHLRKSPDYYANVLKKVMMLKEEYMLNMIFICEPRSSFYPWPYDNYEKKFEEIIIGNPNNKVLNLSSILNQIEKEHGLRLENDGGVQKLVKYKKGRAKILKEIQYDLSAGIQSVSPEIYEYIDTHDINQATYIDGCHLNENGHRIAAQEIFKFLKSEKIVP